jgi:hypothetical protein
MKIKMCIVVLIGMIVTTNSFSQNIPSYVPKNGLIGWWPFNGNANDESGNGNNGTVNGATLTNDKNGKKNSAYSFNGLNNYISTSRTSLSNFSFSIWFNTAQIVPYSSLIDAYKENWEIYLSSLRPTFTTFSSPSKYTEYISDQSIIKNQWNHLVCTFSSGTVKMYLNNLLISTFQNVNITSNTNGNYYFGASISGTPQFYNGILDDISYYNRAISEQEVNQLYAQCSKETATSTNFKTPVYSSSASFLLTAQPIGGVFKGNAVVNNKFEPTKAKLGTNYVDYLFKNTSACNDSTRFALIVSDTLGKICTKTIFDTITTHLTVTDTLKIKVGITTGLYANQVNLIKIFPNPTASDLVIDFGNQEMIKGYILTINDLSGKQVYKENIQTQKSIVKLSTLGSKGIYKINIMNDNNILIDSRSIVLE